MLTIPPGPLNDVHFWAVFSFSMASTNKETYTKKPKSFKEQVELLKQRGLNFEDEQRAVKILTYVSYNRLSNYWFPMLKEPKADEFFKEGSKFIDVFRLYQFDSELRTLTFNAIEQLEVAIRTQLIYHLSIKNNSGFWYLDKEHFNTIPNYSSTLNKLIKNYGDSKQDYLIKYKTKYTNSMPPAWKMFEVATFRTISTILKNLKEQKQIIPIGKSFGVHHSVLTSWVECLVYVRNVCAHHQRLWNIVLTLSPVWLKKPQNNWVNKWENDINAKNPKDKKLKLYAALCMIAYMLKFANPYNTFKDNFFKLIEIPKFKSTINLADMGFPENWQQEPLWSK